MDPTKPILDIYNTSYYANKEKPTKYSNKASEPYPTNTSNIHHKQNSNYHKQIQNYSKKSSHQPSYSELKDKYQELYQAYNEKAEKLSHMESDVERYKMDYNQMRRELEGAKERNQQLQSNLVQKNMELQDCYRRLQEELKGGGSQMRATDTSIQRLEDGLKEAIQSNFQLLKESTLSQLRQYIP